MNGKDIYCGIFGTPAAQEKYDRVIAEWLLVGQQTLPPSASENRVNESIISINDLILAYFTRHVTSYYVKKGRLPAGHTLDIVGSAPGLTISLLTSGASYDVATNGTPDFVNGAAGVNLTIRNDTLAGKSSYFGSGDIGQISLASASFLNVFGRADLGSVFGSSLDQAGTISFEDLNGSITGLEHIATLNAFGDIRGEVGVNAGIDQLLPVQRLGISQK